MRLNIMPPNIALSALLGLAVAGAPSLAMATTPMNPDSPCVSNPAFISADTKPQPASAFKGITRELTIRQIVEKIGPARRDVGSGLHVLQWPVADGRVFSVSVPDFCSKPMAAGFLRPVMRPKPRPGAPPVR